MPDTLTIRRPDDLHLHVRDGDLLRAVLPPTARVFGRALCMPNLVPPVTTGQAGREYLARIRAATPQETGFVPLLAAYLTDETDPDALARAHRDGVFVAAKLYPAGATTNSADGVTDVARIRPVLERMAEIGMPLCVHGEVVDDAVDVFDREAVFLDRVLAPTLDAVPGLRVVFEHLTSAVGVDFVRTTPHRVAATVTAHHLVLDRNDLFRGGLRPHAYCLPVAKRARDREVLCEAVTSGDPRFFLGTDSAPHPVGDKERDHGCAGIFSAPVALSVYAQVFAEHDALDRLEGFASLHGARFYGLDPNPGRVTLERAPWTPPRELGGVRVFRGGEPLSWRITAMG